MDYHLVVKDVSEETLNRFKAYAISLGAQLEAV